MKLANKHMALCASLIVLVAAANGSVTHPNTQQQSAAPTKSELLTADLFTALTQNNLIAVQAAVNAGADVNGRNWLGMTPLAWSSLTGDIESVRFLVSRGAHVNDDTIYGSALTQASQSPPQKLDKVGLFLLEHGAKVNPTRFDRSTPLMGASWGGGIGMVRKLLERKADPNQRNDDGATALIFAARGNRLEVAKTLLAAGAKVNAVDKMKRSPLHYAALDGFARMAALLTAHGAAVNSLDATGASPLHLAARYSGDAETVQSLIRAGASKDHMDANGKTPYVLASRRGYGAAAALLTNSRGRTIGLEAIASNNVNRAITPSLNAIQKSMKVFPTKSGCVSCHHQGLGLIALGHAAKRQFAVDGKLIGAYMNQLAEDGKRGGAATHAAAMDPALAKVIPAVDIGDFSYGAGYFLGAFKAHGVPANPGFADASLVIGGLQYPDGAWRFGGPRGIMQSSNVTTTAMVLGVLNAYWPPDKGAELNKLKDRSKAWLTSLQPKSAEDMASRLMGLKEVGADSETLRKAALALLGAQRPDGGWRSPGATQSDAYTTGLSMFALRTAGELPTSNVSIGKAVAFLLRTQDEDGTWYVPKSTPAFNNHFDGGFSHGYAQYASFAGTCWATLGLLETVEMRSAKK